MHKDVTQQLPQRAINDKSPEKPSQRDQMSVTISVVDADGFSVMKKTVRKPSVARKPVETQNGFSALQGEDF